MGEVATDVTEAFVKKSRTCENRCKVELYYCYTMAHTLYIVYHTHRFDIIAVLKFSFLPGNYYINITIVVIFRKYFEYLLPWFQSVVFFFFTNSIQ